MKVEPKNEHISSIDLRVDTPTEMHLNKRPLEIQVDTVVNDTLSPLSKKKKIIEPISDDCVGLVLEFLSVKDIIDCTKASRSFYQMALQVLKLKHDIDYSFIRSKISQNNNLLIPHIENIGMCSEGTFSGYWGSIDINESGDLTRLMAHDWVDTNFPTNETIDTQQYNFEFLGSLRCWQINIEKVPQPFRVHKKSTLEGEPGIIPKKYAMIFRGMMDALNKDAQTAQECFTQNKFMSPKFSLNEPWVDIMINTTLLKNDPKKFILRYRIEGIQTAMETTYGYKHTQKTINGFIQILREIQKDTVFDKDTVTFFAGVTMEITYSEVYKSKFVSRSGGCELASAVENVLLKISKK